MEKSDHEMTRGALTPGCAMWAPILPNVPAPRESVRVENRDAVAVAPGSDAMPQAKAAWRKPDPTRIKND